MRQNAASVDPVARLRECLPEMPIIILSKAMEPKSQVLNIQDYVIDGETVIPLFSSESAMRESVGKENLGKPVIKIKRELLSQVCSDHQIFLLDVKLPTQLRFTAVELKSAFPGEAKQ